MLMLGNRSALSGLETEISSVSKAAPEPGIDLPDSHFMSIGRYALPGGPVVEVRGQIGPDYGELQDLFSSPLLAKPCAVPDVVLQYAAMPNNQEALWRDGHFLANGPQTLGEGFSLVFEIVLSLLERHDLLCICLLYTSPSPRDRTRTRMPSSA